MFFVVNVNGVEVLSTSHFFEVFPLRGFLAVA